MSKKTKIFILPLVASGHANPICGVVYELCQIPNVECTIYGADEFKGMMEKTGAKFRLYASRGIADMKTPSINKENKNKIFAELQNKMIDMAYVVIPQILKDVESDKPDLIFYDSNFLVARFILRAIRAKRWNVKFAEFYPNIIFSAEILKQNPEAFQFDFGLLLNILKVSFRQIGLSWTYKYLMINMLKMSLAEENTIKIVAVFPEFHPEVEKYDSSYKFVGQCVAEEAREIEKANDIEMDALLEKFPIKQNADDSKPSTVNKTKLVLMSLGSVFNNNFDVYENFINDLCKYDQSPDHHFKMSQLQFIVSTGETSLKTLNEKAAKGELTLPSNVLLRPRVPQLDILKRADLFITHSGQNSTTEAIKYGVPMVCVPIFGDQPVLAKICSELGLGVRLDANNLKPNEIGDAIDQVLSDEKYATKMREFSNISAKYNGRRDGAKLLVEFIAKN